MKRRLDALKRIGRLQALMHDLGRWRLLAVESEQARLSDDLRLLFDILGADEIANGIDTRLVSRRVRSLQVRIDQVGRDQDNARRSVLTQGTRARLAEL